MKKGEATSNSGIDIEKLLKILEDLKPHLTDPDEYFGIYDDDVEKLCEVLGWERM